MKRFRIDDAQDHITHDAIARSATRLIKAGSVLVVNRSGILKHSLPVAVTGCEVTVNQDMKALEPFDGVQAEYVAWAIRSFERDILHTCSKNGTTVQNIDFSKFLAFEIPLPEPGEQARVVADLEEKLSDLDAGVSALRRAQANLKRYRASVLKAACEGRLVQTEAELARREGRSYETGSDLLSRLQKMETKAKKPAILPRLGDGDLPEGWAWACLGQLATVSGGLTKNPKRSKSRSIVPYLRVANVYENELRLSEIERIGVEEPELRKLLLAKGDLLIVEGNGSPRQIGRVAMWDGSINPIVHQNHIIKGRCFDSESAGWILYWLISQRGRRLIELVSSSTSGLYTLSITKVAGLPVPVPPLLEQVRIVAEVERRLSVVTAIEATLAVELRRSVRLRQAILARAFGDAGPAAAVPLRA